MTGCWYSDPKERAKFAELTQQLSNLLEKEAGYLDVHHSLRWRTNTKPQEDASRAKPPILKGVDKEVGKKSVKLAEVEIESSGSV